MHKKVTNFETVFEVIYIFAIYVYIAEVHN